jgi:hypothetical protein
MQKRNSKFCTIICFEERDYSALSVDFSTYQISVEKFGDVDTDFKIPTILIGWSRIKELFQDSRISKKKLGNNLYWTFSGSEDLPQQKKDLEKFIRRSLKEFIPKDYRPFDCILDGDVFQAVDSIFEKDRTFCYFGTNEALYVYGPKAFTGISLKSIDFVGSDSKGFLEFIINKYNPTFFNFDNIPQHLRSEDFKIRTLENVSWICSNSLVTETSLFKFSPLRSNENELAFFMSKLNDNIDCSLSKDETIMSRYSRKDIINEWLSSQTIHFAENIELRLKYSNKRTITGRINCVDKRFNPQHLARKSEERNRIASRFNKGEIAVFDYVSFETKLSVLLTKDKEFIGRMSGLDMHVETAKALYSKKTISESERSVGKQVNHSIIYGIGSERLNALLAEKGVDTGSVKEVRKLLKPIIDNSKRVSEEFKKTGYIVNPYRSVIYPQKEWAVYNNYVQSIAADLVVDKLFAIKKLLHGMRSKFMYQVYDSFVFDMHPEESFLIERIKETLQKSGSYHFDTEYVKGNTLMDCTSQKEPEEIDAVD